MARPELDPSDPRWTALRSHPLAEATENRSTASSLPEPIRPPTSESFLPSLAAAINAPNNDRTPLPFNLHPNLEDYHNPIHGLGIRASASPVLDIAQPAVNRISAHFEASGLPPVPDCVGEDLRLENFNRTPSPLSGAFNRLDFSDDLEDSFVAPRIYMPDAVKQKHLDRLRDFPDCLASDFIGQPTEESGQCDDLDDERMGRLQLFHSSLLAGLNARNSRRGRSNMERLSMVESLRDELKESFEVTGTSDFLEDSDPTGLGARASDAIENKHSTDLDTRTPHNTESKGLADLDTCASNVTESKGSTTATETSDDLSAAKMVNSMTPHEETEESLDRLIDALIAEDGKDPDPEVLSIGPGATCALPAALFETDANEGLTDGEVAARRKKYGWNRMREQRQNLFLKFLSFFMGPVQWVMEVAVILTCVLRDWIDFAIIIGLLLMNAVVGFSQEYHAGNIVDSLKKTLALRALAVRNGSIVEISSGEVVLGDILHIQDGTIVAADGKLVCEDAYIQVDQSGITGESLAVDKHQGDMIFASSAVKRGTTCMIVTAIGDHTFVGTAAALVKQAGKSTGHFTQVLNGMSNTLLIFVVFTLLLIWIASYYRSNPIIQILEFTLAITATGVPVGLPVVVTTTLAVGASYLAKRKAIVQNLAAIESLAGVEILCSDKTGTLTRNKLTLGEPYVVPGITTEGLMLTACLAVNRTKGGIDAIDKVLLKELRNYPWAKSQIVTYTTLEFHPFDPVSKKVTAHVQAVNGEKVICVKGAPMAVLKTVEDDTTLGDQFFKDYEAKVNEFANRGFRSLGIARKRQGKPWEVLGIIPCSDPPRHDTAHTISEAQGLGLSIKMLTGDAVAIARETARELGLGTNIYNAERLGLTGAGSMPGSEINDFVEAADGFAEVYPQHKYSVVEILQRRGYLVAMTGDGVNDAASLKKADTGIAVEGASDAARSAADIVFLAPGLSAIIDAIKISRQIFHRMYSYVVYRIALSIHLELFLGLWMVIRNETLDLRLIVLLAIFADIATLTIAYDNASYSQSPVKWNRPRLWGESIVLGWILAGGSWITLGSMLLQGEDGGVIEGSGSRDGVIFLQVTLTQSWLILITRVTGSGSESLWSNRPSAYLLAAVLFVNLIGTLLTAYGVFCQPTSWLTILRVWVLSFGVNCVSALAYVVAHTSQKFDNLMHGKSPRGKDKERSREDFGLNMQRMANQHESST